MRHRTSATIVGCALLLQPAPVAAHGAIVLAPPVYGAIERGFDPPQGPFGPGHRGVDFSAVTGTEVTAAAAGTVTFAGRVGSTTAVTISHAEGFETTYSSLASLEVSAGAHVEQGTYIGTVGESHPNAGEGLHFGVKLHGSYVDPQLYLEAADISAALHLAPVVWQPQPSQPPRAFWDALRGPGSFASDTAPCEPVAEPGSHPPPPDDNVVVEVAGIGSRTQGGVKASMYSTGAERLGFPSRRVLRYSYKGARGVFMHEPYATRYSFEDIDLAARRLRSQLARVARLYPGRDVDLIAHSQGGIVARTYLTRYARRETPRLPRVEHLVTFSTPHSGAPIASNTAGLQSSALGRGLLGAIDLVRRRGVGIPDPNAVSVQELAPGSSLMESLAGQDVIFGARVLALAMSDDPVVPADRARWPGHYSRVVPPVVALNPHNAILSSPQARAIAYDFLRGGPQACESSWDGIGSAMGRAIGFLEGHISTGVNALSSMLSLP